MKPACPTCYQTALVRPQTDAKGAAVYVCENCHNVWTSHRRLPFGITHPNPDLSHIILSVN